MIVMDASVLIAHLSPADAHHAAATAIMLRVPRGTALVHPLTLAEVLVGGVRVGRGQEMRAHLESAGIEVAPYDVGEPLRLAELRAATGLKLPDCCVLQAAIDHGASLATFDDALALVASRHGVPVVS